VASAIATSASAWLVSSPGTVWYSSSSRRHRIAPNLRNPISELGTKDRLHRVVPDGGGGPQALLREQRGAAVPGGVVGQDIGGVGVALDQRRGALKGAGGLPQQRIAVGGAPVTFCR